MVRINLLPREVIEKRRFEERVKYVLAGGVLLLVILGGAYALMAFQAGLLNAELQDRQQTEANLRTQAESFAIFEEKETELQARTALAQQALAGRIAWGRLANELSLVLPSDVWVVTLQGAEEAGLSALLRTPDAPNDTPEIGHKTVARTLVRLADLEQLYNVWPVSSSKTDYEDQPVIDFSVSASVLVPGQESIDGTDAGTGQ